MNWLRDILAVVQHELRLVRTDPFPAVVLIAMPLVVTAFITPAYDLVFAHLTMGKVRGATQSVPGMSVTFAFFVVAFVGFSLFREHGWGTWQRLRASPVHPLALLVGKVSLPFALAVTQQVVLLTFGIALFGLRVRGTPIALGAVIAAFSLCLVTLGMALSAFASTIHQVNATANLGAMVCAGLGGGFTPVFTLPAWARLLAPFVPSYWALRGYRAVILNSGVVTVVVASGVLLIFAAVFAGMFAMRFAFDEKKATWT